MPKKMKLKLEDLKVQSFVTSETGVKGGGAIDTYFCQSSPPPYFTQQCQDSRVSYCIACGTYFQSCIEYC